MEKCARALARSVRYVGAATVEFLYDLETCKYFFLELNPRLQVRHLSQSPKYFALLLGGSASCQVQAA